MSLFKALLYFLCCILVHIYWSRLDVKEVHLTCRSFVTSDAKKVSKISMNYQFTTKVLWNNFTKLWSNDTKTIDLEWRIVCKSVCIKCSINLTDIPLLTLNRLACLIFHNCIKSIYLKRYCFNIEICEVNEQVLKTNFTMW